jgi:hypothetical protein
MRSPREIAFRLEQEFRNIQLLLLPPWPHPESPAPLSAFPDPTTIARDLRDTAFAAGLLRWADQVLDHRFPLLGFTIDTGPSMEWRRDYVHQRATGLNYFRLIPYLDAARAGDHKIVWELNRHQHLVLLAQAFLFSNRGAYLDEIAAQLNRWWEQNPFQRGINWTSALEVAFRAFSWIWLYHLAGRELAPNLRYRLLQSLEQHGRHLENNLSVYFSPNTHLLGEAVVLDALGRLFPSFPRARQWVQLGSTTVLQELRRQVRPDGAHFEQSTYYHVYALDMFLFHAVVSGASREYRDTLSRMADFLHALMGPERSLPFFGDDDGGRWFHPYGARDEFGRATLATCATLLGREDLTFDPEDLYPQAAWWLGRTQDCARAAYASRLFGESGLAVMHSVSGRAIFDAGGFGPGRAGHSHSDSLSLVARAGGHPILVDSGTYTYVGDPDQRNAFRGTSAHSTIRIDGKDQAIPMGPFWWNAPPQVRVLHWRSSEDQDEIAAECRYAEFVHRRMLRFVKPDWMFILDYVNGPPGQHHLEQFWHLADQRAHAHLHLGSMAEPLACQHSYVYGAKQPAQCLVVRRTTALPATFAAAICLATNASVQITEATDAAVFAVAHPYYLQTRLAMVL